MITDFLKKPTQGSVFKIIWGQLMGVTVTQDPKPGNLKKIVNIKYVSIVGRLLGMRHLPMGVFWNRCPKNVHYTIIKDTLIGGLV